MQILNEILNFLNAHPEYAYITIFGILLACGFGLPVPEDITLVAGGILTSQGVVTFWEVLIISMLGVLIGDGIIFTFGRVGGEKVKNSRLFRRFLTAKREETVQRWYKTHGEKVIFFARFMPGLRMPLFLTAGIFKVPTWKFLTLDGFAALISVPVWIWVGDLFGQNLGVLDHKIKQMQMGLYSILLLVGLSFFIYWYVKKKILGKGI